MQTQMPQSPELRPQPTPEVPAIHSPEGQEVRQSEALPKAEETPRPPVERTTVLPIEPPAAIVENPEAESEESKGILKPDREAVFAAKILRDDFLRDQDPHRYVKRVSEQQKLCLKKWFGIDLEL